MRPTDLLIPESSIILYPQSYNKRGEERLHSVQGVTPDGRDVNVKLRVDDAMLGKESTPSIAEFSREDIKAKNLCLSSVDNSPDKREGVLLFTNCEPDGENRRGVPTYIARWAYVLAAHSEAPDPVIGQGRVVVADDSPAIRKIRAEIDELHKEKPSGWEALVHHKEKELSDPTLFSFFGHIYETENQILVPLSEKNEIEKFTRDTFNRLTVNGAVGGVLFRFVSPDESEIADKSTHEIFPKWQRGKGYQDAEAVLGWFFRTQLTRIPDSHSVLMMPIQRYASGPSFRNYYFGKNPEESMVRLNKWFMVNGEPTLAPVAFTLNKREDANDQFIAKYYPLGGIPKAISQYGLHKPKDKNDPVALYRQDERDGLALKTGLNNISAIYLPEWIKSALGKAQEPDGEDAANGTPELIQVTSEKAPEPPDATFDAIDLSDLSDLSEFEEEPLDKASMDDDQINSDKTETAKEIEEHPVDQDDSILVIMDESNDIDIDMEIINKDLAGEDSDLEFIDDPHGADETNTQLQAQEESSSIPHDIARILHGVEEKQNHGEEEQDVDSSLSVEAQSKSEAPPADDEDVMTESQSMDDGIALTDQAEVHQESGQEKLGDTDQDEAPEQLVGLARFMKKRGLLKP